MTEELAEDYEPITETQDGEMVVNLDDSEMAYCKVMMDEIFGRKNYVTTVIVEAATPSSFKTFKRLLQNSSCQPI